ncbi:hypothetical protein ACIBI9_49830 [Nonomuraea sp. NPDC050451]|uniref:hypothetical protein n=1 Tax=Nonomuraea sp. NPDC050451 TaxID=3364364 RepID=UPI0037AC7AF5
MAGAILPFLHFGWALLATALADPSQCGHFGCIGPFVEAWEVGRWLVPVLAYPFAALVTAPGASRRQRGLGVALFLVFCGALVLSG